MPKDRHAKRRRQPPDPQTQQGEGEGEEKEQVTLISTRERERERPSPSTYPTPLPDSPGPFRPSPVGDDGGDGEDSPPSIPSSFDSSSAGPGLHNYEGRAVPVPVPHHREGPLIELESSTEPSPVGSLPREMQAGVLWDRDREEEDVMGRTIVSSAAPGQGARRRTGTGPGPARLPVPAPSPPLLSTHEGFGSFSQSGSGTVRARPSNNAQRSRSAVMDLYDVGVVDAEEMQLASEDGDGMKETALPVPATKRKTRTGRTASSTGTATATGKGTGKGEKDTVKSARFDSSSGRYFLILTYVSGGLQIWDYTDLGGIKQVLNVHSLGSITEGDGEEEEVVDVCLLPHEEDVRLAILTPTKLLAFSLITHSITGTLAIPHAQGHGTAKSIRTSERGFIVLSTLSPPTLLIIASSPALRILHTIPSSSLVPFAHPPPPPSRRRSFSAIEDDAAGERAREEDPKPEPEPVFALSGRLLVYASTPLTRVSPMAGAGTSSSSSPPPPQAGPESGIYPLTSNGYMGFSAPASIPSFANMNMNLNVNLSKENAVDFARGAADVVGRFGGRVYEVASKAATSSTVAGGGGDAEGAGQGQGAGAMTLKNVWGGMRTLGGMALDAARQRTVSPLASGSASSKHTSADGKSATPSGTRSASADEPREGWFVTVLDLSPLKGKGKKGPEVVAHFVTSPSVGGANASQIGMVGFTGDGNGVVVGGREGTGVRVFGVRSVGRSSSSSSSDAAGSPEKANVRGKTDVQPMLTPPVHLYTLHRGMTRAQFVDNAGIVGSADGRFVGAATRRKGTVHLWGVDPGGGVPGVGSYVRGRLGNREDVGEGVGGVGVEVGVLGRVRLGGGQGKEQQDQEKKETEKRKAPAATTPIAFTFLPPSFPLPPSLTPPPPPLHSPSSPTFRPSSVTSLSSFASSSPSPRDPSLHRQYHYDRHLSPSSLEKESGGEMGKGGKRERRNWVDLVVFDVERGRMEVRRVGFEIPFDSAVSGSAGGSGGGGGLWESVGGLVSRFSPPASGGAGTGGRTRRLSSGGGYQIVTRPSGGEAAGRGGEGMNVREAVVASWSLGRAKGDVEVFGGVGVSAVSSVSMQEKEKEGARVPISESLAQAELSTSSTSPQIVPRSLYLSHQFSFYSLGEDYHALVRRKRLDLLSSDSGSPGREERKVEVRREVYVVPGSSGSLPSSGGGGGSNEFNENALSRGEMMRRRVSMSGTGSFDEPLASALSSSASPASGSAEVIPMLPNGDMYARKGTGMGRMGMGRMGMTKWRIGEEVGEGLRGVRRRYVSGSGSGGKEKRDGERREGGEGEGEAEKSVPLEFDEEDEDFVLRPPSDEDEGVEPSMSIRHQHSHHSIDSENEDKDKEFGVELHMDADGEMYEGPSASGAGGDVEGWAWEREDRGAIEEAERFDEFLGGGVVDLGGAEGGAGDGGRGKKKRKGRKV